MMRSGEGRLLGAQGARMAAGRRAINPLDNWLEWRSNGCNPIPLKQKLVMAVGTGHAARDTTHRSGDQQEPGKPALAGIFAVKLPGPGSDGRPGLVRASLRSATDLRIPRRRRRGAWRRLSETIEAERAAGTTATAHHVEEHYGLRDGADVQIGAGHPVGAHLARAGRPAGQSAAVGLGQISDLDGHHDGRCAHWPRRLTYVSAGPAAVRTAPGSRTDRSCRTGGADPNPDPNRFPRVQSRCRWG